LDGVDDVSPLADAVSVFDPGFADVQATSAPATIDRVRLEIERRDRMVIGCWLRTER
jgi:hypothetical protein